MHNPREDNLPKEDANAKGSEIVVDIGKTEGWEELKKETTAAADPC